ncbi:MAG: LTA synthase family protein [Elusimicrobiales bacterium]|nr:LTA synthase family protein [Elusimicrobiales bacterium]
MPEKIYAAFSRMSDFSARFLLNRYALFTGFLYLYMLVWRKAGGLPVYSNTLRLEMPVLLALYWYFNRILRRNLFQPYIAALPVFLLYTWHDAYYLVYGQIFPPAAIHELPVLFHVLPAAWTAAVLAAALLPALLFLAVVDWRRRFRAVIAGALCAALFCASLAIFPQAFIAVFTAIASPSVEWSDYENAAKNGRLMVMCLREAQRQLAVKTLASYHDGADYARWKGELADFLAKNNNGHNVHLLVLESLLDPSLFKGLRLSQDPRHPEFRKIFGGKTGFSVSPVFGGGTAQVEFEALCGVPAYRHTSGIEFNTFDKAPVDCLPQLLRETGYRAIATHPFKPQLYNRLRAYPVLGFGELYFPGEYFAGKTWLSIKEESGAEGALFDGDLFRRLLVFLNSAKPPVFDYVLGMYGHYPSGLDTSVRPPVIKSDSGDKKLDKVINQFYYRTGALAEFVNELAKKDPRSLIVAVGDHLPSLARGINTYRQFRYLPSARDPEHTTRIFIVQDGKPVAYPLIHHYDIQGIILDYITDGKYCRRWKCAHLGDTRDKDKLFNRYMRIMAEGVKS